MYLPRLTIHQLSSSELATVINGPPNCAAFTWLYFRSFHHAPHPKIIEHLFMCDYHLFFGHPKGLSTSPRHLPKSNQVDFAWFSWIMALDGMLVEGRVPVLNPPPTQPGGSGVPRSRCNTNSSWVQGCHTAAPRAGMKWTLKLLETDIQMYASNCVINIYILYIHTRFCWENNLYKLLVFGWCQDQTAAVLVGEVICWECHLSLRSGISPRPRLGHDSGDVSHGRCSVSSAGSTLNILNIGPVEN